MIYDYCEDSATEQEIEEISATEDDADDWGSLDDATEAPSLQGIKKEIEENEANSEFYFAKTFDFPSGKDDGWLNDDGFYVLKACESFCNIEGSENKSIKDIL
ncbi:hypothetical protein L596_025242 [Steinernema carpocapsae]|uniref:Uncharacterized protein n=1 Tax=Steinernema carpocapsae TaxID=34508 RepID=A0A4U5M783_STECR|nr:hypothetical protein L596_025242 [Steinernema carpocapsae]